MPSLVFKNAEVNVGIVSKSGTLTYEGANEILKAGFGISTAIGIGGDPIIGMAYDEILREFQSDDLTKAILMIGESGGDLEIRASEVRKAQISKPIVAFIAGSSAPKGRKMGHAGAIIDGESGSAAYKMKVLNDAGVYVVDTPTKISQALKQILG